MPHFHRNRLGNSPFSGIRTCPLSTQTYLEIHPFLEYCVSKFHPNRFGFIFPEIQFFLLPSKQTWKLTFFWNPVCPTPPQTNLEIHFFLNRTCPIPLKQTWKVIFFGLFPCPKPGFNLSRFTSGHLFVFSKSDMRSHVWFYKKKKRKKKGEVN